ncbi:unnamed protein product, partial [Laminaria digitata]
TEQHRHNTAEVAVYSIITYLWGLETRGQYTMTKVRHSASQVGIYTKAHARYAARTAFSDNDRTPRTAAGCREQARARAQCIMETFDGVKVFILSGDLKQHLSKPRFQGLFDRVHMSLTAVDIAGSDGINSALADDAVITMDTGRYMVPFNKEQQRSFIGKACGLAYDRGWEPLFGAERSSDGPRTPAKDAELNMDHVGFSFNRKPAYA